MEEIKNTVADTVTETAENPAVETQPQEPVKTYTQEEVDSIAANKKLAAERKVRKEYERSYGPLLNALRKGTGKESVEEITSHLSEFFGGKEIDVNERPEPSGDDLNILARADADSIIRLGTDEVAEEVSRLAEIGVDNLSSREKATLNILSDYVKDSDRRSRLRKLGVTDEVINSKEFIEFGSQFNKDTPIETVYKLYEQTHQTEGNKTVGSTKSSPTKDPAVKDFYTPEEADKFTTEDFLKNPALLQAVERSMQKWGK